MDIVGFAKGIRKRLEEDRATMDDIETNLEVLRNAIADCNAGIERLENLKVPYQQSIEKGEQMLKNIETYVLTDDERLDIECDKDSKLDWYRKNNPGMQIGRI